MRPLLAALILLLAARARAAPAEGELGAGFLIGDPTGGTAKYFFDPRQSVDAALAVSDGFTLIGDYSYHFWDVLPQPKKGELAAYASAGVRLETVGYNNVLFRALGGLSYWPKFKRPFEFFLELGPGLRVAPDIRWRMEGGFGLRAYFLPKSEKR